MSRSNVDRKRVDTRSAYFMIPFSSRPGNSDLWGKRSEQGSPMEERMDVDWEKTEKNLLRCWKCPGYLA